MKKRNGLIRTLVYTASIVGFTATFPTFNQLAFADSDPQIKTINVSGEGKINVTPDVAYIEVGVQTQENSVVQAQAKNADSMQKVYDTLDNQQIHQDDIQTVSFAVNPLFTWDQNKQVFQGYQVVHILRVTDRDLDHMGQLIDSLTQSGANRIENVQYGTEKSEQYQLKALDLAMDDAQQKANHIAEKLGLPQLSIVNIRENTGSTGPILPIMSKVAGSNNNQTQISTGQITISASIEASYAF